MGSIALSGIVVRNAIILVDYIDERRRSGSTLEEAALEAGERRLRPIFLTTMAAAVGVTPMLLSGSSLWSPLASVLASGLIFSMFFVLLVVPVLYVIVEKRNDHKVLATVVAMFVFAAAGHAQSPQSARKLTLPEAVDLALKQNPDLKIIRAKIRGAQFDVAAARASERPQLKTAADDFVVGRTQVLNIPAGALGVYPGLGPVPNVSSTIGQGSHNLFIASTTLEQPLTQLIKLRAARRATDASVRLSQADLRKAENELALQVRHVYLQILIGRLERQAMTFEISAAETKFKESTDAVSAGNVLEIAALTQKTNLLQARYQVRSVENQISDLTATLNSLMDLPIDGQLDLQPISPEPDVALLSIGEYTAIGIKENPEIQAAIQSVEKVRQGVRIAKADYIPDVGVFAQYTYQNGVPFLVHNNATAGVRMTWNVFDWGKRSALIGEREAELVQAEENVRRLQQRVTVQVEKSYRDLELAREMITTARAVLAQARETRRLGGDRYFVGVSLASEDSKVKADEASAEANLLRADLNYLLAKSALEVATGVTPR
jgi:outer membrane protein TolC